MLSLKWIFDGLLLWFLVSIPLGNCSSTDGNGRKTYVVRYKNGENTIPVTVVLDYKKQAEYVINMNTRTPSKSVTFYDFKQKSIAYKDMRNKECFIGKLTNETLQTENEVLRNLQNPLEMNPRPLQLDSTRSSLTPTEVRNMAGQKIAMFCRKMATWMLQEPPGLARSRRQAIHRIEKTYSHHGHEKYEYSKYGRETYEVHHLPLSSTQHEDSRQDTGQQNSDRRTLQTVDPRTQINHLPSDNNPSTNNRQIYHRGYGQGHPATANGVPSDGLNGLHPPPNSRLYSHPLRYNNTGTGSVQNSTFLRHQLPQSISPPGLAPGYGTSSGTSPGQPVTNHRLPIRTADEPYYLPRLSSARTLGNLSHPSSYVQQLQPVQSGAATSGPYQQAIAPRSRIRTPLSVLERGNGISHNDYLPDHLRSISQPTSNLSLRNTGRELEINPYNNGTRDRARIDSDVVLKPKLYDSNQGAYDKDVTSTNERIVSAANDLANSRSPSFRSSQTNFGSPRTHHTTTGHHRADIPSEDSENSQPSRPRNGLRPRLMNSTRNDGRLMPIPGIIPKNGRHPNVLKLFTPDEIVIDVGKIPKKPDFPLTNGRKKQRVPGTNGQAAERSWDVRRAEQTAGRVWHRTYGNGQPPVAGSQQDDFLTNRAIHSRRRPLPPVVPPLRQSNVPQVAALPPGVSVYPRHPNAPFADLAGTPAVRRPVLSVSNIYPQPPPHRQRHLRKKQRSFLACCAPGYAGSQQQQCCSRQSAVPHHQRSSFARSCCSRTARRVKQHRQVTNKDGGDQQQPAPQNRKAPTTEEMCDMKMMCRTLYQSTQAVKVCRQPNVPGC